MNLRIGFRKYAKERSSSLLRPPNPIKGPLRTDSRLDWSCLPSERNHLRCASGLAGLRSLPGVLPSQRHLVTGAFPRGSRGPLFDDVDEQIALLEISAG